VERSYACTWNWVKESQIRQREDQGGGGGEEKKESEQISSVKGKCLSCRKTTTAQTGERTGKTDVR